MKLYAWQPNGYGQLSYYVMAESEKEAKAAVESSDDFEGWSSISYLKTSEKIEDYYVLTVLNDLEVITNDNA